VEKAAWASFTVNTLRSHRSMTCLAQEQESTKERLISAGADYERQEEKYNCEIERLQEKLNKVNNNNNNISVHIGGQNSTIVALHSLKSLA
jgi:hypothetical protein